MGVLLCTILCWKYATCFWLLQGSQLRDCLSLRTDYALYFCWKLLKSMETAGKGMDASCIVRWPWTYGGRVESYDLKEVSLGVKLTRAGLVMIKTVNLMWSKSHLGDKSLAMTLIEFLGCVNWGRKTHTKYEGHSFMGWWSLGLNKMGKTDRAPVIIFLSFSAKSSRGPTTSHWCLQCLPATISCKCRPK